MEFIVGWHNYGVILVALVGQITFAQSPTYCPSGNNPLFVTASASRNKTIKSFNYPWDYYNYLECEWRIQTESKLNSSYVLRVVFNDFDLEGEPASSSSVCPYDNLTFYDGYSDLSPLLGSYCGTVHPEVIYSTGNNLYIKFNTDNANTFRGFSISVLAVDREKASLICRPSREERISKIVGRSSSGTIFTPDYPVPYQDYTTCVWSIYVPDGRRVKLTFTDFELGKSVVATKDNFCKQIFDMDYVEIHNGPWSTGGLLGIYCGKKMPFDVYSTGPHMWMKFRANPDGVRGNKGFKAYFEAVDLLYDEEHCLPGNTNNLNLKLTGSYGTLQSPEYYPPQLYCEWLITVPEGRKVELSFERFDLDAPKSGEYGCGDYVQIHDGDSGESNTIHSFCGSVIPKPLRSSGQHMYIRFQGDSENDTPHRGFKATFKAVKEFPTLAVSFGVIVGVIVLITMVGCAVHHIKRKRTPNRGAAVEYPMSTTTNSASRSTQEPLQPAGNTSSPSVGYAPVPTNPPPPEYPHPLESPPPYPGKEGEPQYPPPGQSYPWLQSSGSAPVPESP